jgi:hypothetical protein
VVAADFTGTGFISILGSGGNGVFSYNRTTSTLPTSTAAGTFRGLLAVGAPGLAGDLQQKFGEISVVPGSVVVESSAPTPGSSIVMTAVTLPAARKAFTLPIIGGNCLFEVSAGVGAGAFYFSEGPTYGGKLSAKVRGEALCLVEVEGSVEMIGLKSGATWSYSGEGRIRGECLVAEFDERVRFTWKNGDWDVDY